MLKIAKSRQNTVVRQIKIKKSYLLEKNKRAIIEKELIVF
jgi:hypothetical protein